MSDVFSAFVLRIHGASSVQPVLPARFEPAPPAPDAWLDPGLFVGPPPPMARATGPDETDARSPEVSLPAWGPRDRRDVLRQAIDAPRITLPVAQPPHDTAGPRDEERGVDAIGEPEARIDVGAVIDAAVRASAAAMARTASSTPGPTAGADDAPAIDRSSMAPDAHAAEPAWSGRPPADERVGVAPAPAAPGPTIEVHIGRIVVTAPPPPARPAPAVRQARPSAAGLSLRDYLSRRSRR